MDHSPPFLRRCLEASQWLASIWQVQMKGYLVRYTIKSGNYGAFSSGLQKNGHNLLIWRTCAIENAGFNICFCLRCCSPGKQIQWLTARPVNRRASVPTNCCLKSKAKQELVSSKNRILMHKGQWKQKCWVLNEPLGLFVNVLILTRIRSVENSQEKWILLSQLSGAVPLGRIYQVGFPAFSAC